MLISELHSSPLAAPVSLRICSKLTAALSYPQLEVRATLEREREREKKRRRGIEKEGGIRVLNMK